jgi:putative aldouronate transport system permease protein
MAFITGNTAKRIGKRRKIIWRRFIPVYVMALPGIIYLIINNYMPMFGITIAFKELDYRAGLLGSPWVGLKNFEFLFRSRDAWQITWNTVSYNVVFIMLGVVFGIACAIFLNEVRGRIKVKIYQSLILIPFLMSWVVASYLAYAFLATDTGFINNSILRPLGVDPITWYASPKYWPVILTICNMWKGIGFGTVIYYSNLIGISPEYYEAAKIDGASKWQQIINITIPLLKPMIIIMTIMSLGRIFASDFGLFYQIPRNQGILYSTTRTLDVYVYNALMRNNDFAMSSAASVYQAVVGFVFLMGANAIIRKINAENALF